MKIRENYTCPLEIVHDITRGKWKTIIIFQMRNKSCSLSELEHSIEGITQKMLLEQLNELKDFGMVEKIVSKGYPLHVEYFLTDMGGRVLQAINILQDVGIEYMMQNGMEDILKQKGLYPTKYR